MSRFPVCRHGRQTYEFFAAPFRAPLHAFAALTFAWQDDSVLLCDIKGRGWCVPSGRVEPGETSDVAARRESLEEGGALLDGLQYIGCYRVTDAFAVRWADCFAAEVAELGEIRAVAESRSRRFVASTELAGVYYMWNPLTERVFAHAHTIVKRLRNARS